MSDEFTAYRIKGFDAGLQERGMRSAHKDGYRGRMRIVGFRVITEESNEREKTNRIIQQREERR